MNVGRHVKVFRASAFIFNRVKDQTDIQTDEERDDTPEKTCNKYSHGNYKGHLVSIHNNVELHQAVCTMYRDHPGKDHYWIGLHMKIEHIFYGYAYVWTDGTDNSFTSWAYRQPDRFLSREECVEMNYWDWTLWNDERCGQQRSYMCAVWIG
ncbi:C-type lectin BpLec-like isoform X2 [Siniperca chuatsi]|uniref:C-type lectin BpLec-like isoform X2 n=1 Tax=Siniperca chuatsi TaxID=119488 RepID=UPI001CE120D7|nr:C-type lectin BpLec-like isoform X2 [Siniperca chuatsi]